MGCKFGFLFVFYFLFFIFVFGYVAAPKLSWGLGQYDWIPIVMTDLPTPQWTMDKYRLSLLRHILVDESAKRKLRKILLVSLFIIITCLKWLIHIVLCYMTIGVNELSIVFCLIVLEIREYQAITKSFLLVPSILLGESTR